MKIENARFSRHCTMIAVLALLAGIVVTVEAAAQSAGRLIKAEREAAVHAQSGPILPLLIPVGAPRVYPGYPGEGGEFLLGDI